MPEHGFHALQPDGAGDPGQGHRQQHLEEASRHGEESDDGASQQVVPTHIVEAAAGHRQGQEAEHPLLHWVEGAGYIKGDGNHKKPDGEVHQVWMDGQGVGQPIGPQIG